VSQHIILASFCESLDIRKSLHETFVVGNHDSDLCLLQHDFRDPHPVWSRVLLPRQILAAMPLEPVENGPLEIGDVFWFQFQKGLQVSAAIGIESATSLRSSQRQAFEELDAKFAEKRKGRRELVAGSWLNTLKAELALNLIQITSTDNP
jgi:hypothetical protein